jgi:3'-phosphoadenosine 5'-phosphosulfate sulfotransferase (PAPS reductase)/FAD synthetase
VAFSGGKDSTVLLDMVLAQADLPILWWDDGWDYPETLDFLASTERDRGLKIVRIRNRGNIASFAVWAGHLDWQGHNPGPWDYECKSFDDHSRLIYELGFNGVFLGLRTEESTRRLFSLRYTGPLYWVKREQLWHCCPLYNWTTMDVWAYILSRGMAYNSVYDKLSELKIAPQFQRVGPLIAWGEDCYATLKRGWPELFNHFAAEFPEARCFV